LLKNPSKSTLAHDAVAAAVLHKHHPIILIGAGLIQFVYDLRLRLANRGYPSEKSISAIFRASFSRERGNSRQICVLSEDSAWQNSTGSNHNKLSELLCHEFKPKLHSNAGVAVQTKDLPYNSKGSGTLVLADLNIASRSSWPRSRLWPCLVFIHVRFCKEIRIRKDHVRFWDFLFAFSGLFLPTVGQIGRCIPWKLDTFTCSG